MSRRLGRPCSISSWRGLLGAVCAGLLPAASASALSIGGIDSNTQFTGAGLAVADAGILTFDDQFNSTNLPELGVVTSEDIPGFDLTNARVGFEALLSGTQRNGTDVFDPASTNINRARFVGTGGGELFILDPTDNTTVLLSFDLSFIDVSQTAIAFPGVDPDGLILLGNADPASFNTARGSALTVSGGTLNAVVGGIGTPAVLSILMATIDPPLLSSADRKGYFNDNFLSGVGSPPVATTVWDLTIIPEPTTALLLGAGLLGLLAFARRSAAR